MESLNVIYFPQLGYLICTPMRDEWTRGESIQVVDAWTFQFFSETHAYFKSQEMFEMDKHVGDLHSMIVDRELEIIQSLLEEILVHSEVMMKSCEVCAELDVLLSLAQTSRMNGYVRPEMVEENIIDIVQGRHPLHELILDAFVANDARLLGGAGLGASPEYPYGSESDWNSVLLCTGANACGKSVYMKQIALIQIMAQVGCFVPAESATLGLVDKIFTRVSTRETVSKAQSAFMIDLNQVSLALRNCTARSLIVLDEFGKGTLSSDGAGLFCGVLKHLLHRGSQCPKVLVATHFHDVFTDDIFDVENWPISFCHMQVMFTSDAPTDAPTTTNGSESGYTTSQTGAGRHVHQGPVKEKITYLYRVAEGLSLNSHAAQCAANFGIPMPIVERAQHISNLISAHEVQQLLDEDMTEEEQADLKDAEAICKRFLEWDLDNREGFEVKAKLSWVLGMEDDV